MRRAIVVALTTLAVLAPAGVAQARPGDADPNRPVPTFAGAHVVVCVKIIAHDHLSQSGKPNNVVRVSCR